MRWYEKNMTVVLLLIFFFPVGLFLMWKYSKWNFIGKIIISALIALACVTAIVNPPPALSPQPSGTISAPSDGESKIEENKDPTESDPSDSDSKVKENEDKAEAEAKDLENVTALIDGLNDDSSRSDYEAAKSAFDELSSKLQKELPESLVSKLDEYSLLTVTIEQSVDSAIEKAFADKDKVTITENAGSEDTGDFIVSIYLKGSDNFTNNMIRAGMLIEASDILKELQSRSDISRVALFWSFPLVDVYGNTKEETVMKIQLDGDSLHNINFDNFDHNNFSVISDGYFEHPALSAK